MKKIKVKTSALSGIGNALLDGKRMTLKQLCYEGNCNMTVAGAALSQLLSLWAELGLGITNGWDGRYRMDLAPGLAERGRELLRREVEARNAKKAAHRSRNSKAA